MTSDEQTRFSEGGATVVVTHLEPEIVVRVEGEIDIANAGSLRARIEQWLDSNPRDLRLECQGLSFIDSTGLSLVVMLHNELAARGRHLVLYGLGPAVRRPFEVTELTDVLDIRDQSS